MPKPLHSLGVIDSDEETQISQTAFQYHAVRPKKIVGNGHPWRRSFQRKTRTGCGSCPETFATKLIALATCCHLEGDGGAQDNPGLSQ